jgi:hypothetical protein
MAQIKLYLTIDVPDEEFDEAHLVLENEVPELVSDKGWEIVDVEVK